MDELGLIIERIMYIVHCVGICILLFICLCEFIHLITHWNEIINNVFVPYWEKQDRKAEKKRLKAEKKARIEAQRWWYQ